MSLIEMIGYTAAGLATMTAWGKFDWHRSKKIEELGDQLVREWEKTSLNKSDCPYAVGIFSFYDRQRYKRLYRDIERHRRY